jgi:hypothetical protein
VQQYQQFNTSSVERGWDQQALKNQQLLENALPATAELLAFIVG